MTGAGYICHELRGPWCYDRVRVKRTSVQAGQAIMRPGRRLARGAASGVEGADEGLDFNRHGCRLTAATLASFPSSLAEVRSGVAVRLQASHRYRHHAHDRARCRFQRPGWQLEGVSVPASSKRSSPLQLLQSNALPCRSFAPPGSGPLVFSRVRATTDRIYGS